MLIGGNLKFKEFLESFDLQSENINSKYKTKAVKFYRENLDNIQYGRDREQQPNYEQGRELFEFQSKMGGGGIMAFGSDDLVQDERQVDSKLKQNWEKGKQTVSSWGMNIGRGFSSLVAKTKQKFESRKAEETTEEQEEQQPSKVKKTFSKGVTSLKSGMGTLGSKLSLGWSMFSSKTMFQVSSMPTSRSSLVGLVPLLQLAASLQFRVSFSMASEESGTTVQLSPVQ